MTDFYGRQYNCLSEPEKGLTLAFLMLQLDPLSPGMPVAAYELAWAAAGGVGGAREVAYRHVFSLVNVPVEPFEFVITLEGAWFEAWAAAIATEETDPSAECPCTIFY